MKSFLILLLLFVATSSANAQLSLTGYDNPYFTQFLTTTTYVAQTGDEQFDRLIKISLDWNWKFTNLVYQSQPGYEGTFSYLTPLTVTVGPYELTMICVMIPGSLYDTHMRNIIACVPLRCASNTRHHFFTMNAQLNNLITELMLS